jgi:hypothetical protein
MPTTSNIYQTPPRLPYGLHYRAGYVTPFPPQLSPKFPALETNPPQALTKTWMLSRASETDPPSMSENKG